MWRSSHSELQQTLNELEGQTVSILSLSPLRNYNGLEITCEIEHEALTQGVDYDSRWETPKVISLDVRKSLKCKFLCKHFKCYIYVS